MRRVYSVGLIWSSSVDDVICSSCTHTRAHMCTHIQKQVAKDSLFNRPSLKAKKNAMSTE